MQEAKTGNYYSPRREGAGLMDLHAAMKTPVVVTETKSGEGKAALKQVGDKFSFTLDLKNYSNEKLTYKLAGTVQSDLAVQGSEFPGSQRNLQKRYSRCGRREQRHVPDFLHGRLEESKFGRD